MLNDLRVAARTLLKDRGFTATAILTITLGIAANATVFTLFNGSSSGHSPSTIQAASSS